MIVKQESFKPRVKVMNANSTVNRTNLNFEEEWFGWALRSKLKRWSRSLLQNYVRYWKQRFVFRNKVYSQGNKITTDNERMLREGWTQLSFAGTQTDRFWKPCQRWRVQVHADFNIFKSRVQLSGHNANKAVGHQTPSQYPCAWTRLVLSSTVVWERI